MNQPRQRYAHIYQGAKGCSRGQRFLSKLHKGMNSGDVTTAFKEVTEIREKTMQKINLTKLAQDVTLRRNYLGDMK